MIERFEHIRLAGRTNIAHAAVIYATVVEVSVKRTAGWRLA